MMFEPFQKVPRLSRECVVTEKIDGTNAQIAIFGLGCRADESIARRIPSITTIPIYRDESNDRITTPSESWDWLLDGGGPVNGTYFMCAGSRKRYITPDKDNFGFAQWVLENSDTLWQLGEGRHYGEWWGRGIQRGYERTEKYFSLFDVHRWTKERVHLCDILSGVEKKRPAPLCCDVVPTIAIDTFSDDFIQQCLNTLREQGSLAAPGYMRPEGVMIYHTRSKQLYKKTIENDSVGKEYGA